MSALLEASEMERLENTSAPELLEWAIGEYGDALAISTSFQTGGMVILDMAARISPQVRVFTLDTGRLPEETYRMIEVVRERYGIAVETVSPDPAELEEMIARHGPNLFYREVPMRMLCCQVRKVRPLARKLAGLKAWVVGLRREQNQARAEVRRIEQTNGRLKLSPLAGWTAADVREYIQRHNVPVHPLYAAGYRSIGCAPCTRPVGAADEERAGRWWWEQDADKECGIHFSPEGKAERKLDVLLGEILEARRA